MRVKTKPFFIIVGLLLTVSIGLGVYSYISHEKANKIIEQQKLEIKNNNNEIEKLTSEKDNLSNELNTLKQDFNNKEQELNTCKTDLAKKKLNNYRLTSYYPEETSNHTGSGLNTSDFQINDKGWYTYQGKLVLAGPTIYLQKSFGTKSNRHYFKYYNTIKLTIDGITHDGIILDSCGACMTVSENRLDLFVSSKEYVIDRGYKGNNPVLIEY